MKRTAVFYFMMSVALVFSQTVYAISHPTDIVTDLERQDALDNYGIMIPDEPDREKYLEDMEKYKDRREKRNDARDDYEDDVGDYIEAVQAYRQAVEVDGILYWNNKITSVFDSADKYMERIGQYLEIYDADLFGKWGLALNEVQPVEPDKPEYDVVDNDKYDTYKEYVRDLISYSNGLELRIEGYLEIESSRKDQGMDSGHVAGKTVQEIGCYLNQDKCYVSFNEKYGAMACASETFSWEASSVTGKKVFSMLMSAYVTKKSVAFYISEQCLDGQPTFDYISLVQDP